MAGDDIVRASEPFDVSLPGLGVPINVATGDLWAADDPIVKGREHLFGPVRLRRSSDYGRSAVDVDTETADAPPGTRRAPVRRRGVDTGPRSGSAERPADAQPPALTDDAPAKTDKATGAGAPDGVKPKGNPGA